MISWRVTVWARFTNMSEGVKTINTICRGIASSVDKNGRTVLKCSMIDGWINFYVDESNMGCA